MKELLIIHLLCFISIVCSAGQEPPVLTMTTDQPIGSRFMLELTPRIAGTIIKIDFGDGVLIAKVLENDYPNFLFGELKGPIVKVYTSSFDLIGIICLKCKLTDIDVSKNKALTRLECNDNLLETLDVSGNNALNTLDCSKNQLTTLNVSKNKSLKSLLCFNNLLTTLDLSKNNQLSYLSCSYNVLTALDVSKNENLYYLMCSNNELTVLDLSKNVGITSKYLDYSSNNLSESEVTMPVAVEYKKKTYPEFGLGLDGGYLAIPFTRKDRPSSLHLGYVGAEMTISTDRKYPYGEGTIHQLLIGGGVYLGKFNNGITSETRSIPAVSLCYSTGGVALLNFKTTVSQYHINPSVGLNFINLLKMNVGYSFGTKAVNEVKMTGFTIGINLTFGILGSYWVDVSN